MEDGRDNYADILEELDPLPELPETADDRFFTKDALDFQYTTGPAENNPLFPTWGSTGAEMAAIGAAAAANATTSATAPSLSTSPTPPPPAAGCVPAVAATAAGSPSKASPRAPRATRGGGGGGKKRALPSPPPEPAHTNPSGRSSRGRGVAQTAAAVAVPPTTADRTVFLRERLGGESVSSGNSSTSAGSGSDNGSASDDVAGEWEGGAETGDAKKNGNGKRNRRGVARRAKKPFMRSGAAAAAAAAANAPSTSSAAAAVTAPSAVGASASQAPTKAALRTRYGGSSSKSNRRHRKSTARGGGGGGASDGSSSSVLGSGSTTSSVSSRSSRGGGGGGRGGGSRSNSIDVGAYASWDSLVKPFKQQWDHVEGPPAAAAAEAAWSAAVGIPKLPSSPLASGGVCSVFSAEPCPNSTTAFSVEQCSAQAHPMAVASYVLRVRCAGGAHIVRRTWDDIVSLCSLLSRDMASSAGAASAEGSIGADKAAAAAVEFTPADVLARNAASGFLKDIISRPGMACSTPVRRFLELEYLDGTLRGGLVDHSRANAARQVASLAALTTTAAATASAAQGAFAVGDNNNDTAAAAAAAAPGGAETPATTSSGGDSGDLESAFDGEQQPPSVVVPRPAQSLPAHPDAARDLAAVCRCLGELGASAFTPAPSSSSVPVAFRSAAPYWSAVGEEAGGSGGGGDGGGGERVAPQRGVALLA